MNCKQGEVAYLTKGALPGFEDMVVKCAKFYPILQAIEAGSGRLKICTNVWEFEEPIKNRIDGSVAACAHDAVMRPIRPGEGQDETLTWKPVPKSDEEKEREGKQIEALR